MTLPDVNVLIYAFQQNAPLHRISRAWLDGVTAGDSQFAISKLALAAVVRITTHAGGYRTPASVADALEFCDALLAQPHCETIEPGERHWEIFRRLCVETRTSGPRITDAWYAALAIESGCEWVTFDRDFTRFPGLRCTILSASNP